jgi:hypothetical protein
MRIIKNKNTKLQNFVNGVIWWHAKTNLKNSNNKRIQKDGLPIHVYKSIPIIYINNNDREITISNSKQMN